MIGRPSLLLLTAASAAVAGIANAVGAVAPDSPATPPAASSRLGVAIADDIAARDKGAVRRGRSLDLREQAVRAAEARLKTSADAGPQPAAGDGAPPPADAPPSPDQFDDLARIYQAMKPVAAAAVMEQLDLDVQMRVAQKMRERSTAMILAAMTPKSAAALTMALARRHAGRLPAPPTAGPRPVALRR